MKKVALFMMLIMIASGCAVQLSENTCGSLQNVAKRVMTDRQNGVTQEEALADLALFTHGRADAQHFHEVTSEIITAAYLEPVGATDAEKANIISEFVSDVGDKCLSGEISPTYNPVPRIAPVIR
jgi:hypothetical protein